MNIMLSCRRVRSIVRTRFTLLVVALLAVPLMAGSAPTGRAEDVGLSSERLQRIDQLIQRYIDASEISGAVTVVARRGRIVRFEAQGLMEVESKTPMRKDAIFRMASMSKPVTGVAIMMLVEEGKVRLTDPVSRFIPEFRDTKAAMPKSVPPLQPLAAGQPPREPEIYLVPANREITVRDLLTHTSGLESGGLGSREAARMVPRNTSSSLAEYIPRLGAVPLDFQPGTQWRYSALAGIETLGRIVEVASGLTFDQFLRQRLFEPLDMKDTAFYPAADRLPRVVTLYRRTPKGLERQETPAWLSTKTLFSGGGGLWSTAADYAQFAVMLANGGQLDGKRVLSPRTVDLMAANHVGNMYTGTGAGGNVSGMGFGLTVDVVMDAVAVLAGERRSNGSFGWGGAFGTYFWVDPKEQLVGLLMIQTPAGALRRDFENAVMQAIVE
jgi:CubicO group peptidase (beta-lactamase class C family)